MKKPLAALSAASASLLTTVLNSALKRQHLANSHVRTGPGQKTLYTHHRAIAGARKAGVNRRGKPHQHKRQRERIARQIAEGSLTPANGLWIEK